MVSVAPVSTISPPYMTATRSAMPATTPKSWVTRIIAMPNSARTSWMSWRICALDAHVEGRSRLVGHDDLGFRGESKGQHDPLAHTAAQLVWVCPQLTSRAGDPDVAQEIDGTLTCRCAAETPVRPEELFELGADPTGRVQGRDRVLEHVRDLVSPHASQHRFRGPEDVLAVQQHLAPDGGVVG